MKFGRNRYNNLSTGDAVIGFLILLSVLAAVVVVGYGWIMNIVALAHATAFSGLVVLRAIGVFIPFIGAVLGYV